MYKSEGATDTVLMTNTNKLAALTVLRINSLYQVMELGQFLMYHYMYPEVETPEVSDPTTPKMMYGAVYDLVQCEDRIADGCIITTPHGVFRVVGFHVEQIAETKNEAKARRARIRRLERNVRAGVNFDNGAGGSF